MCCQGGEECSSRGMMWALTAGGQVIRRPRTHIYVVDSGGYQCNRLEGGRPGGDRGRVVRGRVDGTCSTQASKSKLYNVAVADFHTYFVGCQEWGVQRLGSTMRACTWDEEEQRGLPEAVQPAQGSWSLGPGGDGMLLRTPMKVEPTGGGYVSRPDGSEEPPSHGSHLFPWRHWQRPCHGQFDQARWVRKTHIPARLIPAWAFYRRRKGHCCISAALAKTAPME